MISDVLAFATPGCLLITGLINHQCIRTAYTLDIAAIIIVRGKRPSEQVVQLAGELKIPILATKYILFETCGRLYQNRIVGCIRKVEKNVNSCKE
ncbi:MAG: transcriptional regulator [Deltaproteobacteria bacterium]|nr:transcriptional regulator [Deltaproteobacteria bacterium]